MKSNRFYILYVVFVLLAWSIYMITTNSFHVFEQGWKASLTMIFGAFIAGGTSEGGGAVAFPVFTLLFKLSPSVARNFSFAIQSVGMTAASILILSLKVKVEKKVLLGSIIGGVPGFLLGTFFIEPYMNPKLLKLLFVSIWLSFAIILFVKNYKQMPCFDFLQPLQTNEKILLIVFAFIGGVITSFFGNGIDMLIFCLTTLFFGLNEKVATATSVLIMSIFSILGFALHFFYVKDVAPISFNFWLCCIPVVIFFAPLGAYVISKLSRIAVSIFLKAIILIQYIGALLILKPSFSKFSYSVLSVVIGVALFYLLLLRGQHIKKSIHKFYN